MSDIFYMAWQYLAHHKVKTLLLLFSIALIIYLPIGLKVIVDQSAESLTARAEATPLVVGAKGSPLELVLNTLYFESDAPEGMTYSGTARVSGYGLGMAIPIYARFRAESQPIIGTTLDYFNFRGLEIAEGRHMAVLGECVLGATAAQRLGVSSGESVVSSPDSVFDIAGVYPLKMNVVGVLGRTDSSDDAAVFVDVKTAWVIAGLAHGHQDLSKPGAAAQVLKKEGGIVVGNAAVVQYNEITPDNMESFHFHGDTSAFPITAVIAVPRDAKASALLQGKYLGADERVQIVEPLDVIDELLATVVSVRSYVITAVIVVGVSTLITTVLVFLLSLRLRRREILTMHRIGGSRKQIAGILASEIVITVLIGLCLAGVLTALTARYGAAVIQSIVMG
jgi:putative ABC transport system permease protein